MVQLGLKLGDSRELHLESLLHVFKFLGDSGENVAELHHHRTGLARWTGRAGTAARTGRTPRTACTPRARSARSAPRTPSTAILTLVSLAAVRLHRARRHGRSIARLSIAGRHRFRST